MSSRRDIIPYLWLLAVSILLGIAVGLSIPHAHADPATSPGEAWATGHAAEICIALDKTPTITGLVSVLDTTQRQSHLSDFATGEAVALSVNFVCPHHQKLLREFVANHNRPGEKL